MSANIIPSLGAITPIESMMKGGKASDLLNPTNVMGDAMSVLSKPSYLLSNPIKDSGKH